MTADRPLMTMETVLTTTRGEPITARDVVTHLKLKGEFRTAICDLIETRVISIACATHRIKLPAAALAEGSAQRRAMLGLSDDGRFRTWLRLNGVTAEQWTEQARLALLRDRLKQHLITDTLVEERFHAQRGRYVSVSLGRLVVRSRDEAMALRKMLAADPGRFEELCRTCSEDSATRTAGGFLGVVRPGVLPPEIEAEVFAAAKGAVLGPYAEPAGTALYKVYCRTEAELGSSLREMLREQIFAEWLRREVHAMPA